MNCPTCDSPEPHLHPAIQWEGEVSICPDAFHLTGTPRNLPQYVANVLALRKERGMAQEGE